MNTVAELTLEPQLRAPETMAHLPLLLVRVKPEPEGVAVKVAHVPVVYQVPALMMQPSGLPLVVTCRVPLPEKGVPGVLVGEVLVVVVVVVTRDWLCACCPPFECAVGVVGFECFLDFFCLGLGVSVVGEKVCALEGGARFAFLGELLGADFMGLACMLLLGFGILSGSGFVSEEIRSLARFLFFFFVASLGREETSS